MSEANGFLMTRHVLSVHHQNRLRLVRFQNTIGKYVLPWFGHSTIRSHNLNFLDIFVTDNICILMTEFHVLRLNPTNHRPDI